MTRWVKVGGALALGAVAVATVGALRSEPAGAVVYQASEPYTAPRDLDTARLRGPEQPIFFRHDIHAGEYGIDCRYCHAYVERSSSPGLPSTATCMGCHLIVGAGRPEVQKIQESQRTQTPIEWVEVHTMSPFVHFPHHRHVVNAGIACQDCHGPVERMARVWQYSSLKMGWCLDCHKQSTYAGDPSRPVTTDCTACHY